MEFFFVHSIWGLSKFLCLLEKKEIDLLKATEAHTSITIMFRNTSNGEFHKFQSSSNFQLCTYRIDDIPARAMQQHKNEGKGKFLSKKAEKKKTNDKTSKNCCWILCNRIVVVVGALSILAFLFFEFFLIALPLVYSAFFFYFHIELILRHSLFSLKRCATLP